MMHAHRSGNPGRNRFLRYGMMACCAVMLVPVAAFFVAGGSVSGLWANAGVFAPLALCVGAHLVMHRMMGKSCHGGTDAGAEEIEAPAPADTPRTMIAKRTGKQVAHTENVQG
ncbi:DUF2933 domain-containing protein [Mameliella sp. CS4]|nr:DUF2933 domain-containing protein [Mameliella sp. CS4]